MLVFVQEMLVFVQEMLVFVQEMFDWSVTQEFVYTQDTVRLLTSTYYIHNTVSSLSG